MRLIGSRSARRFAAAAVVAALAAATAGCQTTQSTPTAAALPLMAVADRSDADWRQDLAVYGQQYRANPGNVDAGAPLRAGIARYRTARAGGRCPRAGLARQPA
jgi:poly(3-hydroxybutyrate) depolymerase